jgi:hypothetical protein
MTHQVFFVSRPYFSGVYIYTRIMPVRCNGQQNMLVKILILQYTKHSIR